MVGCLFDFFIILSATIWLLKLALKGELSAEQTAIFLFGIVVLIGISRALRVGLGRLLFRVGIPVASLIVFAATCGHGNIREITAILGSVFALTMILFGIYLTIAGPFRKK